MTQLEDLSLTTRLTILIITVVLTCAALFVLEAGGQSHQANTSPHAEHLVQLDRYAIEQAYIEHVMKLFNIWVTDYSEAPPKAVRGMANLRSAYDRALAAIEKREKELQQRGEMR